MSKLFGKHIREERKNRQLTVQQIATACETSRGYISLIENGWRLPGKKVLPKIAQVLDLKTSVVLNWYLEAIREKIQ